MLSKRFGSLYDQQNIPASCSTESNADLKHEIGCMIIQCSGAPNNSEAIERFLRKPPRKKEPLTSSKHDQDFNHRLVPDYHSAERSEKRNLNPVPGRRLGRNESRAACLEMSKLSVNQRSDRHRVGHLPTNQKPDTNSRDFRPISRLRGFSRQKINLNQESATDSGVDVKVHPNDYRVNDHTRYDVNKQRGYYGNVKTDVPTSDLRRLRKSSRRLNEKKPELPPKDEILLPSHLPDSKAQRLLCPEDFPQQQSSFAERRKVFHSTENDWHQGRCRYQRKKVTESIEEASPLVSKSR